MGNQEFANIAKCMVRDWCNAQWAIYKTPLTIDDVHVVWICKILGNNKAMLATSVADGMYFEVTYNGERCEFYFDAYKKQQNDCIPRENWTEAFA